MKLSNQEFSLLEAAIRKEIKTLSFCLNTNAECMLLAELLKLSQTIQTKAQRLVEIKHERYPAENP